MIYFNSVSISIQFECFCLFLFPAKTLSQNNLQKYAEDIIFANVMGHIKTPNSKIMPKRDELDKKYYRISEVADILGLPQSTLRFWENEFTIIKPKRNEKNRRLYTTADIEVIRLVYYLVKEKGMKLDAAQAEIRRNRSNVSKRVEVIDRLRGIREQLVKMKSEIEKIRY